MMIEKKEIKEILSYTCESCGYVHRSKEGTFRKCDLCNKEICDSCGMYLSSYINHDYEYDCHFIDYIVDNGIYGNRKRCALCEDCLQLMLKKEEDILEDMKKWMHVQRFKK